MRILETDIAAFLDQDTSAEDKYCHNENAEENAMITSWRHVIFDDQFAFHLTPISYLLVDVNIFYVGVLQRLRM